MIQIKNKYVYEISNMENYFGMLPLDIYITLVFFNYNEKEHKNILFSAAELSIFITECLVEALTRDRIDFSKINLSAKDLYISGHPSAKGDTKKTLLFKYGDKFIVVTELIFFNENGMKTESLKMKNATKEDLLKLMLSIHQFSLTLMDEVIKKCSSAHKVNVIEMDKKEDIKDAEYEDIDDEEITDKFDKSNYVQL